MEEASIAVKGGWPGIGLLPRGAVELPLLEGPSTRSCVLAHLYLARAYVLQSNTSNAKAAYKDFFALWKDADGDIPILKEAKAEYAKLR